MTDDTLLKDISGKVSALLAVSLFPRPEKGGLAEKVEFLLRFDISNSEIAAILGTTKRTVEVLKSRRRKRK